MDGVDMESEATARAMAQMDQAGSRQASDELVSALAGVRLAGSRSSQGVRHANGIAGRSRIVPKVSSLATAAA